ncbi:pseudouridine synthase, partial [bacterium]|nr:pseudouridine synthase [bacterium]
MKERLHKILARHGVASRREAERLMAAGRVAVNGVTVTVPGSHAEPAR